MSRKGDGELELEVLHVLWDASESLQPAEVQQRLTANLAYTSVATVLTRLTAKGLVSRQLMGRHFVYEATLTHDEWYAGRMMAILRDTSNHSSLLAGFVSKLSSRDRDALRSLLSEGDDE